MFILPKDAIVCIYWDFWGDPFYIEIEESNEFERAMVHEAMHWVLHSKDEVQVDKAAREMINYVNNLR